MTEGTAVVWKPQMAAIRDQIVEALRTNGGVIHDEKGKVAGLLRELTGIPDTQTNRQNLSRVLELLTREGTIVRDRNAKRTFKIRLVQPHREVAAPTTGQSDNLSILGAAASPSTIDQLIRDCQRVYEGLQDAADKATRFMDNGCVVIDAIAVLQAAGITNRTRAAAIKYYLRRLGLAWAVEAARERDTRRWWWFVGDAEKKPFRAENLRAMATSRTTSYEAQRMAKTGTPWASDPIVWRVDPVTALGDADICDEPAVAVADDTLEGLMTTEQQEPTTAPTIDDDPFKRLVEVAEELERKNEELVAANEELRSAAAAQQSAHADEVATLRGVISVLKDQVARDEEILPRALGLIARYEG